MGLNFDFYLGKKLNQINKSSSIYVVKWERYFSNCIFRIYQTILQNLIEASCQVLKISKAQTIKRVKALLEQVGIFKKRISARIR